MLVLFVFKTRLFAVLFVVLFVVLFDTLFNDLFVVVLFKIEFVKSVAANTSLAINNTEKLIITTKTKLTNFDFFILILSFVYIYYSSTIKYYYTINSN